jgi:hypothetical protein
MGIAPADFSSLPAFLFGTINIRKTAVDNRADIS